MSEKELKNVVLEVASQFQGKVEVNRDLAYVSVGEFYSQGEEAIALISEIDLICEKFDVTVEQAAVFVVDNLT